MIEDDDIFDFVDKLQIHKIRNLLAKPMNYVVQVLSSTYTGPRTPLMAAIWRYLNSADHERGVAWEIVGAIMEACQAYAPDQLRQCDDGGYAPLAKACTRGDIRLVQLLLHMGVPLNEYCCFSQNNSFLCTEVSAQCGQFHMTIFLLSRGGEYRIDLLPEYLEVEFAQNRLPMMVLLYRAMRRCPEALGLLVAVYTDNIARVTELVAYPQARLPFTTEAIFAIFYYALPEHDHACAIMVRPFCRTFAVSDCLALAIACNAPLTFQASLTIVAAEMDLGMANTYLLARLAVLGGHVDWAISLLQRFAEVQEVMAVEEPDVFPDGTPVTPEALQQFNVLFEVISPFQGMDPLETEQGLFPQYFPDDTDLDETLTDLLPIAFDHPRQDLFDALLGTLDDDDDEELVVDVALDWFVESIDQGNFDRFCRLVRLPLSLASYSSVIPQVLALNDHRYAVLTLNAGAITAITNDGDIIVDDQVHALELLQTCHICTQVNVMLQDGDHPLAPRNVLLLMAYNSYTSFQTAPGQWITLIDVAVHGNQGGMARLFAEFGVSPVAFFRRFLANPDQNLAAMVDSVLQGVAECWCASDEVGFYGRWLFLVAHVSPTGNELILMLNQLSVCNALPINTRNVAQQLVIQFTQVDVFGSEPLTELSLRVATGVDFALLRFPWNDEFTRRLLIYVRGHYDNRANLVQADFTQLLIRLRAIRLLRQLNPDLAISLLEHYTNPH